MGSSIVLPENAETLIKEYDAACEQLSEITERKQKDEIEKSISGIILDYTMPRAYWETSDPVEGTPPTCYSKDSLVSFDGKACCHCPFNDFGSRNGESNAKACKESISLFMLRPGNIMPIIVRILVSSKVILQRYLTRLIARMLPVSGGVRKFRWRKQPTKRDSLILHLFY